MDRMWSYAHGTDWHVAIEENTNCILHTYTYVSGETHPSAPRCPEGKPERRRLGGRCQRIPCPGLLFPFARSSSQG